MIRILRLLEYTYEDNKRAEEDMAHWQTPPIGTRRHGNMTLRSTIITEFDFIPDSPESSAAELIEESRSEPNG